MIIYEEIEFPYHAICEILNHDLKKTHLVLIQMIPVEVLLPLFALFTTLTTTLLHLESKPHLVRKLIRRILRKNKKEKWKIRTGKTN